MSWANERGTGYYPVWVVTKILQNSSEGEVERYKLGDYVSLAHSSEFTTAF